MGRLPSPPDDLPETRALPQTSLFDWHSGNLLLKSSGCDSDGSGRVTVGLTSGLGWKVSVLGAGFSIRALEFSKIQWRQWARYAYVLLSNTIGF